MTYREKRAQQSLETEQTILRSAVELFREKGFEKASIRDICTRANITTGAFYHHFPSKEAMFSRGFAPLDAYMESLLAGHEGEAPQDRLWRLLSGYAGFMEAMGPDLVARYYAHRLSVPSSASMDASRFTHRAMLECLADISRQGELSEHIPPQWAADFLYRHFRGVVLDWTLRAGSYPLLPKLEQDYQFFQGAFRT